MIFPLDIFRHLALFCDIKTFLDLTICSKKLRQLYFENLIWSKFIKRDFDTYKYHPTYDLERYIKCTRRMNLNYLENGLITDEGPKFTNFRLLYVDVVPDLEKIINPKNWGLEYQDRYVLSIEIFLTINLYGLLFCDIPNTPDIPNNTTRNILYILKSGTLNIDDETLLKKYENKIADMFLPIRTAVTRIIPSNITAENLIKPETIEKIKQHPDYNEVKLLWLEHGFS